MDKRTCSLICSIVLICITYSASQGNVENHCGMEGVPCDDGKQCIRGEQWCNGQTDCQDESDEAFCKTSRWFNVNKCTSNHFKCDNAQCVPAVTKCDGYKNCKDESDEDYYLCTEKNSEDLESGQGEDFGEISTTTTSFPDLFESTRSPVMALIPQATTDYYDKRIIMESKNKLKETDQRFGYNTPHTPYHSTYGQQQQEQHPSRYYPTNSRLSPDGHSSYQHQTNQDLHPNNRASDTAPTDHFPSNNLQPLQPTPDTIQYQTTSLPRPHFIPSTARPIYFSPSPVNRDIDIGRLPRNSRQHQDPHGGYHSVDRIAFATPPDSSAIANDHYNHNRGRNHPDSSRPDLRTYDTSISASISGVHGQYAGQRHSPERNPISSKQHKLVLPSFYFQRNYTEQYEYRYKDAIQRAESWLLDKRDPSYGWGNDTARALVALSLITNSFLSNVSENSVMKKNLQTHLGIKLLTELKEDLYQENSNGRNCIKLAQYINALVATCLDPRDFFGNNLVERLQNSTNHLMHRYRFVHPFIYITLCLVDAPVSQNDINFLERFLPPQYLDEASRDLQIFATTALACFQHNNPGLQLERKVNEALNQLHNRKLSDGSFGSIYSTALAAQAFLSTNNSWDLKDTLDYLKKNQSHEGSFGDFLATYYILPALSGRSLVYLRNTQCEPPPGLFEGSSILDILNYPGPKIRVFYTIKIGYPTATTTVPTYVSVPPGTTFFDIMRIVELLFPVYKFDYKEISGNKIEVYAISNIPNDAERGFYWHLYLHGNQITYPIQTPEFTGDIREVIPTDGQELVYWYF